MAKSMLKGTKFYRLIQNGIKLNENELFYVVFTMPGLEDEIIELNTRDQLFNKGINAEGNDLGFYSPYTIAIKQDKGLPYDRVTLYDTGDFYRSFKVRVDKGSKTLYIEADTIKPDGTDLQQEWGNSILGLTSESKGVIIRTIIGKYRYEIRKAIFK